MKEMQAVSVPRRRLGGAAVWTLIDQALSSLTNVALSIVVARAVTPTEFGGFSVALIAFTFIIGLLRGAHGINDTSRTGP